MMQMVWNQGADNEQVLDLVDVPEFVLVQFCDLILRRQDLRNPTVRDMLRDLASALKVKFEQKLVEQSMYNQQDLKDSINQIEELLRQLEQERE